MKKLLLLALLAIMTAGCSLDNKDLTNIYDTCIIDSCEYIVISGFNYPTHKGNCRFFAERRKKELEELIKEIGGDK